MQMGPSEGFVRYLANLTGVFREGGQQAVYDTLREKGHDFDDGPSIFAWVTLLSAVPEPAVREYVELLETYGATDLFFAVDLVKVAGNTQQERIAWMLSQGVKMAHAPTLVRCIEKYDEYLQWTPPAPMHHQLPPAQMVESAHVEQQAAMLGVEAEKDGGSQFVSPAEALALCQVAAAGRDQTDATFSSNVPSPVMESPSPVRLVDGSLNSLRVPSEEVVPCPRMNESMSLSCQPPAPALISDNEASHAPLESSRVDIEHQLAGLGPVPSPRLADPSVPLASTSAMGAQSQSPSRTQEREASAARLHDEGRVGSPKAVMGSVRAEEETQAPVDGSTTVDLRQPTAPKSAGAGSWEGNVFLSGASDSDEGDAGRPEVETEVDSEEQQQGQGAGALEAVGQRLGLAVETQNADAVLSSLRSLQALLTTSQEQTDSGVVLRDEELAAIVLPLMRASYIYAETLQEAPATAVRRIWMQVVLQLSKLVSTGEGAQWATLKEALLEEQISDVLVNRLKLRLEGWTEEKDDDGEGNSAVSSLLAVLSSLARHAEDHRLSEALGQAGACEVALQALTTGLESRHATLLGASCCAMMSLCFRHPPNVGRLLELEAHAKVVQTLKLAMGQGDATNGTAPVQASGAQGKQAQVLASWACSCLASLMDYAPSPTAKQELQAQLGTLGLPESLAALLRFKRLQAEPDALVLVMTTVVALLEGSKQNRARMREAGALQTLQAMSLLGGSASSQARALRTRGDSIPRGSSTKGQEAYPELRLWVKRALEMLQHMEMEVEELDDVRKRASEVAQDGNVSAEQNKRQRLEASQAECKLETQGQGGDMMSEAEVRRGDQADSGDAGSNFSGDDMEHDGPINPLPQEPCSSHHLPAQPPQEGDFIDLTMDQDEALDEAVGASVDCMEAPPHEDAETGASSMGEGDQAAGREARLQLGEQADAPTIGEKRSRGRPRKTAVVKQTEQHAVAPQPEVTGLHAPDVIRIQRPSSVSRYVWALMLMLGEANTSGDAAKASQAFRRVVETNPLVQAPGGWDHVLPVLVRALDRFAAMGSVVRPALACLIEITKDEVCCKQLLDLGVDKVLAAVIRAHMRSSDVTMNACTVVMHMASRGCYDVTPELLAAVRDATKKFSSTVFLQTFSSLLVPGSQALKVLADDEGGMAIVRILKRSSSYVQAESALECIAGMCMGDSDAAVVNRQQLGSQGTIEAIDSAITRYSRKAHIVSAAVLALWALSLDNDSNVERMRAAGVAVRLGDPAFQQSGSHHGCHLESCEACMRLELLHRLGVTTSSEDGEVDDSMWRQDGIVTEATEASGGGMGSGPINHTDARGMSMGKGDEEAEREHDSLLGEQSNRPNTDETHSMKRQHEAAILKGRGQQAQQECLEPAGKSAPHSVSALTLMLSEANEAGDVHRASEALSRLHGEAPSCRVSSDWDGLLSALVKALVVFGDSTAVTTPTLSYLEGLTSNTARCRQLLALGVDTGLAAVIRANKASPGTVHKACAVVLNMAKRACHEVSTELVVTVRDAVKNSASGIVLDAFNALAVPGSQACMALTQDGGCAALVRIVRDMRRKSETVQPALQCIATVCVGDSETAVVNRRQLGAQGAIEAIDVALNRFPRSGEVIFAGIKALWALSIGNHQNVERMRQVEVAAALTGPGFQQYVKDPDCSVDFCEMCLRLLTNMALPGVAQRDELGHHGACKLVLKVFERPRPSEIHEEARLLAAALEAMATLCLDCPLNVQRFGLVGCEALCTVLQDRSLSSPEILSLPIFKALRKQACLATARLLETHEHRNLLLAPEVVYATAGCLQVSHLEEDAPYVEAVLLALEAMTGDNVKPQHVPAPRLVQAAIETLRSISIPGRGYELPHRVVELLGKLNVSPGLWAAGVGFISNVLRPSLDGEAIRLREALGAGGGCTVAAEAIGPRTGEPDERVVGSGYWLLEALCLQCPANVGRCIALQVHASALDALRKAGDAAAGRIAQEGDAHGAIRLGLTACGLLGQLLVNATGRRDREKLTQELRRDGACEALLAFLTSPGVCGHAFKEQAVTATVERLLEGHREGTGRLEVSSARTLLESVIAQDLARRCRAATERSLPVVCPTNALQHAGLGGTPSIEAEGSESTEG